VKVAFPGPFPVKLRIPPRRSPAAHGPGQCGRSVSPIVHPRLPGPVLGGPPAGGRAAG
jgi:hypothetical protein